MSGRTPWARLAGLLSLFAAWHPAEAAPYPPEIAAWDAAVRDRQRTDGAAVLDAISRAAAQGEKEIAVPKGDYRFLQTGGNKAFPAHILFSQYHDLTIDFQGSTLWFESEASGLLLSKCRNVTVKNAVLDWDPLPFVQGRISGLDEKAGTLDVKLDPGYERTVPGLAAGGYWRGLVFDPASLRLKPGVAAFGVSFSWKNLQPDGSYRMPFSGFSQIPLAASGIAAGDPIVLLDRMGRAVRVEGCENTVLQDITLYSSPFIGFVENTGKGNTHYLRCRIVRRPGTDRLIAGNADGFNVSNVEVGPTLDACEIDTIGDDFVNVHNDFARVLRQEGPATVVCSRLCYRNALDGPVTVEFFDRKTLQLLGRREAAVETVPRWEIKQEETLADLDHHWHSGEAAGLAYGKTVPAHRLTLDRPIQISGDAVVNCVNFMSAGPVVRSCRFTGSLARGIRLQAPGARIENNVLSWIMGIGISLGSHADFWGEGSYVTDTDIVGNTIEDSCLGGGTGWGRAAIYLLLGGDVRAGHLQRDIRIRDNTISRTGAPAILGFGIDRLTLTGNRIRQYVDRMPLPASREADSLFAVPDSLITAGIGLDSMDGLVMQDNDLADPGAYAQAPVVTLETTPAP